MSTPAPDATDRPTAGQSAGPSVSAAGASRRAEQWAATMAGHGLDVGAPLAVRRAHGTRPTGELSAGGGAAAPPPSIAARTAVHREAREAIEAAQLVDGATRSHEAGNRVVAEEPDPFRTCFERDRDRILHGTTAFRRLAGKTQVFIFPEDHQRTRLTHALEVAQVATSIARAVGLNVALAEAIALGHDCGHGPGGHASEDAFTPYVPGGYDHAVWGADVVLAPLNLCVETLDGIRNHSWSRPAPSTPEAEVVSWADRIAYVCHDFEDAVHAGIVTPAMLPELVRARCGASRAEQLGAFISAMIDTISATGQIAMYEPHAEALAEFRRFNYDHIYMRPASVNQSEAVIRVLRALVEYYADRPNTLPFDGPEHDKNVRSCPAGSAEALHESVSYVAGMTDRFAFNSAIVHLGWDRTSLPHGVGVA